MTLPVRGPEWKGSPAASLRTFLLVKKTIDRHSAQKTKAPQAGNRALVAVKQLPQAAPASTMILAGSTEAVEIRVHPVKHVTVKAKRATRVLTPVWYFANPCYCLHCSSAGYLAE